MRARRAVFIFSAVVWAGRIALASAQDPAAPPSPIPFTEEQAGRGAEVFSSVCLECHARKDFSDVEFRGKWRGRTVFDLFDRMRSTMPESNPGSLARSTYLDVVAYVAKLNGLTAGSAALPDDEDALKKLVLALPSHDLLP
jgi:mono/diheme cytochrome c family protein